jgi:hypothetical protein
MPVYIVYYSQGNSNGPFNVYLSGSSGLNLYASNIPRSQLELGYTVTFPDGIPSSSVDVFDMAYGCFTEQNVPFPSVSPSVTPSITVSPSITPSVTVTPSITVSPSKTPSVTPSATPAPTVSPTQTPSVTPSLSPQASPSATPSITPTPSITRTPSTSPPVVYTLFGSTSSAAYAWGACINANYGVAQYFYCTTYPSGAPIRVFQLIGGSYLPFNGGSLWYVFWLNGVGMPLASYQIDAGGYVLSTQYVNCQ